MQGLEIIRALFDYHHAMTARVWDSVETLSDDDFTQVLDYSMGSVRDQMVHLASVDAAWLKGLLGMENAYQFTYDPADYTTPASARALWESTVKDVAAYVEGLDEDTIASVPENMPGPIWHALAQMANHGTDHRAQVLRQLHDLEADSFPQDLIHHLWMR